MAGDAACRHGYDGRLGPGRRITHFGLLRLTRGCVASISKVEVGEASRRPRIVVKEPGTLIHANDNLAFAA